VKLTEVDRPGAIRRLAAIQTRLQRNQKPTPEDTFFMNQILDAVERRFIAEIRERQAAVPELRRTEFDHLATWGGDLTPGCQRCVENGLIAIRSSSSCDLSCNFCYYGQDRGDVTLLAADQFEIDQRPVTARELKLILSKAMRGPSPLRSIAWVFLEPFAEFDKHPDMVSFVHDLGVYQHLYTNGTLCSPRKLDALASAGLEEIRFNLAATLCADTVLEAMRVARGHFQYLCIESPMTRGYHAAFVDKREAILGTGVDHIHCAELHLNVHNFRAYREEELYQYSRGYVSPMSSRRLTYDLIDLASDEGWTDVTIHDCSNEVKFLRGVSRDRFGLLTYQQELPGVPLRWFRSALERYDLTGDPYQNRIDRSLSYA